MSTTDLVPKAHRKIWKVIKKQGWTCEKTKGGHRRYLPPDNGSYVCTGASPSDTRSVRNFLAELRRHGAEFPRGFRP